MYKKKELMIIFIFLFFSFLCFFFNNNNEKEEKTIIKNSHIIVEVDGEIIRSTKLVFHKPTTYGVVLNKIQYLKNEYSDFSEFNYHEKIVESISINIPTIDINNKYNPNNLNKICINTATKKELISLYQIGEKRADKILLYISQNNKITSWKILKDIISVSDESIELIKKQAYL